VGTPALLHQARRRAGLTLRTLAHRGGTSHATLVAYEHGRKDPTTSTLRRLLAAAGFEAAPGLRPSVSGVDPEARGRELAEVLELAAQFPARHARHLPGPVFGRHHAEHGGT
jgi:transcriptional regulator with XRE-family HTH domain